MLTAKVILGELESKAATDRHGVYDRPSNQPCCSWTPRRTTCSRPRTWWWRSSSSATLLSSEFSLKRGPRHQPYFCIQDWQQWSWTKDKQMQPVWLCFIWGRQFEETFENTQRRKGKQMQPVWISILLSRQVEDSFENPQWRKVKQMQPVWLCILTSRRFEDSYERTPWRKIKQMQPMWICILSGRQSEDSFENPQRRKVKQIATSVTLHPQYAGDLRRHLKTHNGEKVNKCNQCE